MGKKNIVKLNEGQFTKLVSALANESVRRIIKESEDYDYDKIIGRDNEVYECCEEMVDFIDRAVEETGILDNEIFYCAFEYLIWGPEYVSDFEGRKLNWDEDMMTYEGCKEATEYASKYLETLRQEYANDIIDDAMSDLYDALA